MASAIAPDSGRTNTAMPSVNGALVEAPDVAMIAEALAPKSMGFRLKRSKANLSWNTINSLYFCPPSWSPNEPSVRSA